MTTTAELSPLFTEITMSSDDANAIVAALRDIAESDGTHEEELAMIEGFIETLRADLGDSGPADAPKMTPAALASKLVDPALRTVAVQCSVLLAMADGKISPKERARVIEYATALGITPEQYETIEKTISGWVKAGDPSALFS
jgi:tellurite resistance protein